MSAKVIQLSLNAAAEMQDEKQVIETFTFNPEFREAILKLNGIHTHTGIPAFIFPVSFDRYDAIEKECIENVHTELGKYEQLQSFERSAILAVLTDNENKTLMLESIRDYHIDKLQEDTEKEEQEKQPIEYDSVSATLRMHDGTAWTKGTITGISRLFKVISKVTFYCDHCNRLVEIDFPLPVLNIMDIDKKCNKCNKFSKDSLNPEHRNAITIELEDTETFNEMDRLMVYLFDNDTENILVGETVIIKGQVQIINDSKRMFPCLYGESIKYIDRENFTLSEEDIEKNKEFVRKHGINNTIDELVEMFDPSIVGYQHVKKGMLMSAVNTSNNITRNDRINSLLIGDPGLAKSKLAKRITKLVPNSRHESGQSSTGKSLTAIIDKTDNNTFLRPGPIPLAKGAICTINELGRQSIEDQGHLLDVMEEGEFTKNAFGKSVRIKAPTTIIATANPINNSKWRDSKKVDLTEFPVLEPIQDRFDLKFIFKDRKDIVEIRRFADQLTEIEDKKDNMELPDYTEFLTKYIQHAKEIQPKLSKEARHMLKEFYIEIASKFFGSPRIHITLPKLAKAIARLKLKDLADEEEAREAMEFYNIMLLNFQKQVVISQSLRDIAYQECNKVLNNIKEIGAITLEELIKTVCKQNEQLAVYFGYNEKSLKMEDNKKVRRVYDLLLNHSNIKKIQDHPITLQWFADPADPADPIPSNENNFSLPEEEEPEETISGLQFNNGPIHISHTKKVGQEGQEGQQEEGEI